MPSDTQRVNDAERDGLVRRVFLRLLTALGGVLALFMLRHRTTAQGLHVHRPKLPSVDKKPTHLWGMVIDLDKCTGCNACVVACAVENNVMLGDPKLAEEGRVIRWVHLLPFIEGEYPHVRERLLPLHCQHCDRPPCIYVCPVNATYKNPEGLVAQIYPRCIGCRYCVNNCPYTCKFFNWWEPDFPQPLRQGFNPDVSVRPKGVTEKCSFCHHRLQKVKEQAKAEERELKPGDYMPACAEACPAKAIYFGDLNDPESEVSRLARSRRAFRLLEDLGTHPKVIYLTEG